MWNREGQIIEGAYLDTIHYTGVVISSRVMLGGNVQHEVALLEPITVFGEERERILVKENEMFTEVGEVMDVEL